MSSKNKVFLVTGCGKGIGRAITLELAQRASDFFKNFAGIESVSIAGVTRTEKDLETLASEISKINSKVQFLPLVSDFSKTKNIDTALDAVTKKLGFPTDLILNAGNGVFKNPGEFSEEDYNTVFDLNVRGTFWLAQKAFVEFKKLGPAENQNNSISFVTSTASRKAYDQSLLYGASKFAQRGLIDVLRIHCRPLGIRVINLMPGPVSTPMWGDLGVTLKDKMLEPKSVAESLVSALLLSPQACVEEIQIRPVWGDIQRP